MARLIFIRGAVQGVGFRPFVARLAGELGIEGWVRNDRAGVTILASGGEDVLAAFARGLRERCPPAASITDLQEVPLGEDDEGGCEGLAGAGFHIAASEEGGGVASAVITPDLATCEDCLREMFDPADRRYRYPFTNCTQCGPRFSILRRLPYDRPQTTMAGFTMCAACQAEYDSPLDRRHHAQPNACPACGPRLRLLDGAGAELAEGDAALRAAAARLRAGEIVAVKGVGGFHLMADARDGAAVGRLRERKGREAKPLAVMFPDLAGAEAVCAASDTEKGLLQSAAAPIVLLRKREPWNGQIQHGGTEDAEAGGGRRGRAEIAGSVAPENAFLGCLLPYSPLHHLLMREVGFALVATSGNVSDEPICIDNEESVTRLRDIADAFLVHDRPIARPVDDSVVRVAAGRTLFLRRSRGCAPLPVAVPGLADAPDGIATGGHLKNTVALKRGGDFFVSQHLGDLDTVPAREAQREALGALRGLYDGPLGFVACDLHPDYASTRLAEELAGRAVGGTELARVQHHHAHLAACLADNGLVNCRATGPVADTSDADGAADGRRGCNNGGVSLVSATGPVALQSDSAPLVLATGPVALQSPSAPLAMATGAEPTQTRWLGAIWDGTGFGPDRTIWGGEFLLGNVREYERVASLRTFRLPAGERAAREPRLCALGLLHDWLGPEAWEHPRAAGLWRSEEERRVLGQTLARGLNCPATSSLGRLFDAVAALLGLGPAVGGQVGYEGQAAAALEAAAGSDVSWEAAQLIEVEPLAWEWREEAERGPHAPRWRFDLAPAVRVLLDAGLPADAPRLAARFHRTLLDVLVSCAQRLGQTRLVLSGGCFQNALLVEGAVLALQRNGVEPILHRALPPNDGALAVGQLIVASARGVLVPGR